jgi:hypothetical protein
MKNKLQQTNSLTKSKEDPEKLPHFLNTIVFDRIKNVDEKS